MLEESTFFINERNNNFQDLNAYKASVNGMASLQDRDRNQDFRSQIHHFPAAIEGVMESQGFRQYFQCEQGWLKQQAKLHTHDVRALEKIISYIITRCDLCISKVSVVLCPLKCTVAFVSILPSHKNILPGRIFKMYHYLNENGLRCNLCVSHHPGIALRWKIRYHDMIKSMPTRALEG